MYQHTELGGSPEEIKAKLHWLIRKGRVSLAGYRPKKIYGLLSCISGKRMKIVHRVFFYDEQEAIHHGYRPCGHCLKNQYQKWKSTKQKSFT
ncbi:metal-binding protein [Olivibacter sp. CPCC 100613]|uniref:Ada metal-binding domain-containing protein n=1 Tax=Olivibacter sp. CPCC 100613 TaxID=3079931 RepID=UPI002FFD5217